jgi:hypothetical protein
MLSQILLVSLLGLQTAAPGLAWDVSYFHHDATAPQVFVPSAKQERACSRKASVCFSPGDSNISETTEIGSGARPLAVLARDAKSKPVETAYGAVSDQPWQVQMVANLKSRPTKAPIEVDIQDADTPPSMENMFSRVVWEVDMKPANHLGMRFALSPDEGFTASHSYRLRVLQRQGKTSKLLAQGELHLG